MESSDRPSTAVEIDPAELAEEKPSDSFEQFSDGPGGGLLDSTAGIRADGPDRLAEAPARPRGIFDGMPTPSAGRMDHEARLNPKYTFETFVPGSSNRFAHAAAVAVAEAPAKAYNPLFIYGDSGLGKTHLLHAIGTYGRRLEPTMRVRYVSSEEFTNDFINSVRVNDVQSFQRRYRDVDLLLIDDIQFLERAEQTQEAFFHTFNTLQLANKQIVISCDRKPEQLSGLQNRLVTRFKSGLITDVQAPDLELRIAILRKKAAKDGMTLQPGVMEFIASKIQSNIRELEGALIRVVAFGSLNKQEIDLKLAEIVLKDLVSESDRPDITASTIMAVTAGVLRDHPGGPHRQLPDPGAGLGPPDRDVPVPGADRAVAAQDRPDLRRPRPHHRDARRAQDPVADDRAPQRLQPDHRADQPDPVPRPLLISPHLLAPNPGFVSGAQPQHPRSGNRVLPHAVDRDVEMFGSSCGRP